MKCHIPLSLEEIYEPVNVAVPPCNVFKDLMMMPDGEIRHYGTLPYDDPALAPYPGYETVMISSRDNGLNWTLSKVNGPCAGGMVQSPWSGDFITLHCKGLGYSVRRDFKEKGIYVVRAPSPEGPFQCTKISDTQLVPCRQPLPLRSRKRWVGVWDYRRPEDMITEWGLLISDDDGYTWRKVDLPHPPAFVQKPPHKGPRWGECNMEPCIAEYDDGRLHMLIRTSADEYYETFSEDGGDTWTPVRPSIFYSVITSPTLFHLSDGRMLAVWNNTTPLPECDHRQQISADKEMVTGIWEDVFTNRDVLNAAVSSDNGKTWHGFREIALNPERNEVDFRSVMDERDSLDKSIHQSQALELPGKKVLLAYGQSEWCRKIMIFDPDWLEETTAHEDFVKGLGKLSVQLYLKSVAGGFQGVAGHCSYNRRPGAALVPHPQDFRREVLLIGRHPDTRLLSDREGAVWNFPMARKGTVTIRAFEVRGTAGVRFSLMDRWFNPCDEYAAPNAVFTCDYDCAGYLSNSDKNLPLEEWHDIQMQWDLEAGTCVVSSGDVKTVLKMQNPTPTGISYLHIQTLADGADTSGVMFEYLDKK